MYEIRIKFDAVSPEMAKLIFEMMRESFCNQDGAAQELSAQLGTLVGTVGR